MVGHFSALLLLLSAIVYSLGLIISDQVRAGTADNMHVLENDWQFSDTPFGSDWLCWSGSSGFLQIKLGPPDGAKDSGFLHI